jgi:hypothetical protein
VIEKQGTAALKDLLYLDDSNLPPPLWAGKIITPTACFPISTRAGEARMTSGVRQIKDPAGSLTSAV